MKGCLLTHESCLLLAQHGQFGKHGRYEESYVGFETGNAAHASHLLSASALAMPRPPIAFASLGNMVSRCSMSSAAALALAKLEAGGGEVKWLPLVKCWEGLLLRVVLSTRAVAASMRERTSLGAGAIGCLKWDMPPMSACMHAAGWTCLCTMEEASKWVTAAETPTMRTPVRLWVCAA